MIVRFLHYVAIASFISVLSTSCVSHDPLLSNMGHPINSSSNKITTWKGTTQHNVVIQNYDYSCGASSLATLMRYYFNDDVTEQEILDKIEEIFDKEEYSRIQKDGLSFLELEKISQSYGYQAASVRLELSALKKLTGPVIVYLSGKSYKHFVVLRGIKEDKVFLADPSAGNIAESIHDFIKNWKGETFVLGKKGFGTPVDHNLAINSLLGLDNKVRLMRDSLQYYPKRALLKLQ
ncbi:MAG: C39 family peptidase [Candidatus Thiothrix putei]|uniref:C39 family peptidase n=1 Tax=Candidatus Thiothrix putei TaxID=3080811 RepID=A0AA95HIA1_9GAMM|nr:MAG: C39 family peptidase [Candidatus Thiothrix putei]